MNFGRRFNNDEELEGRGDVVPRLIEVEQGQVYERQKQFSLVM